VQTIVGVLPWGKRHSLEQALFRTTRGNFYLDAEAIDQLNYDGALLQMQAEKGSFLLIYQSGGPLLQRKVETLLESNDARVLKQGLAAG
jgi:hypothetical protein